MGITRESFLSKTGRRFDKLEFEGEAYRLRSLKESEKIEYETSLNDGKSFDSKAVRVRLIRYCLVDENEQPFLKKEDEPAMREMDGFLLGLLYDKATRLCGYDKEELENIAKKSESAAD